MAKTATNVTDLARIDANPPSNTKDAPLGHW